MPVYAFKAHSYGACDRAIEKALSPLKLSVGEEVFIKPNFVSKESPSSGIVTRPYFLSRLIAYLIEYTDVKKIAIGDIPKIGLSPQEVYTALGVNALNKGRVRLIDLRHEEKVAIKWKFGWINIPRIALDSFYINVPKLKTHILTGVSLSLKNQKGLLDDETKKRFHIMGLHEPIAELARVIAPRLVVVDGIVGIQGTGPGNTGKKVTSGLVIAGMNSTEVDAACCRLIGFIPENIEHLRIAHSLGLGNLNSSILGDYSRIPFLGSQAFYRKYNIYVWPSAGACTVCTDILQEVRRSALRSPKYFLQLLYYGYLNRLDLLIGKDNSIPMHHGKVICVGDCTRVLAKENNVPCLKGCPPSAKDFFNVLSTARHS